MFSSKLSSVRAVRRCCLSVAYSRISKYKPSQIDYLYTPSRRLLSTSVDKGTEHHSHKPSSSPNLVTRRPPKHHIQVQKLMDESKEFLDTFQTLDTALVGAKLQKLLLDWGQFIPNSTSNHGLFQQAVQYADSLAHVYLDMVLESGASNASNTTRVAAATSLIHPALHGWAKVQRDNPHCNAASRAEHLLKRLLHVHSVTGQRRVQPQTQTYNSVLDSYSKSAAPESPTKARDWLMHMQSQESLVSPDRISFNSVLNAYASRGDAGNAMALFDQMKQHANPKLQPDKYTYSIVMKAWQRSKSPKAPHMTLRLLEELKHRYVASDGKNSQLRPNSSIYSIPMALAGAQKAHELLKEMLAWYQREPDKDTAPQTSHFTICMNAYAKEGDAEQAEQLFMKLLELNRAGYHDVLPNRRCFTILINAWCKQRGSIQRAQALLDRMEELYLNNVGISGERMNTFGYNSVMNAHVRSGNPGSADRVQELFDRMTRLGKEHGNPEMLPDKVSYTTLMQAWLLEGKPGFAQRVEDLLNEMNAAFERTRQSSLKPDVVSYGCAIDAWTKSGEPNSADRAEALLRQMQHLYKLGDASLAPNDVCFNSIINAHSKAGNAEKAEAILQWMEESFKDGNKGAKADAVSYSSCMDAWARSESADAVAKSQQIFATLVHKYKQGDQKCEPSGATFTSLMMALSKCKPPDVARLAKENLKVFQQLGIRLNTIAYNALIHACSCSSGDEHDALELAITTFHTMRTNKAIGVDFITYNSLLHLVDGLISDDDERQAALEDVFRKCKEDDKVNEIILATIKRMASPSTLERLLINEPNTGDETSRH